MQSTIKQSAPSGVVVTIGRQFGSGGRELGRRLAQRLGYDYYDKELLSEAAREAGVAESYMTDRDECEPGYIGPGLTFNMGMSPLTWYQTPSTISADALYGSQSDAIRRLAERGSCVIVGRTADYVLRDHPRLVNVFVHAPEDVCVDRIIGRADEPDRAKARALLRKTNKLRAGYYNFYTDKRWGDAASYDLCFDTSKLPVDDIVEIIATYISRRFPDS